MRYDYVVIGGGHNGLIAANYLAKAGSSVVVIEQRPYLGGMAASYPHVAAAPHHLLSKGAIDSVFIKTTPIIAELGLGAHGFSLIDIESGYGWTDEEGETLCIFNDVSRTAQEIARFSAGDARRYVELQHAFSGLLQVQLPLFAKAAEAIGTFDIVKAAMRVIGDRSARRALSQLAACSAHEAIAANFVSDQLRSLYAYWCEIAGPGDVDGSGLNLASLAVIHRVGCARPRGSMGGLVNALERALRSRGGDVETSAVVTEIIVSGRRASGVRLADGREVAADRGVLSSCAPQVTFGHLLALQHQSDNIRARVPFLPANANNMCPFKVDMAVGGRISFNKANRRREKLDRFVVDATSLVTGTFDEHQQQAAALRQGRMGRHPPTWMTILSHADRSIAPEGDDVAYLYTSAPSQVDGGWAAHACSHADRLVGNASKYLDGLSAEIGRCITTPADFESQYGAPRGCLYHVDMLPTRSLANRPAVGMANIQTDLNGLFLSGAGAHPGGGVFGMPGKLAAHAALGLI